MSKLLFIFERDMPTVSITREVYTRLNDYPEIKVCFKYLADVKRKDIDDNDVIVFIRPNDVYSKRVAREARKVGHTVVVLCDDDLLNLPASSPTIPWRRKGLMGALSEAHVIWSSSKYVTDKYKNLTFGKRTFVGDTVVRPEELKNIEIPMKNDIIKVVYAAAPDHAELFKKYIGPIVNDILSEFENRVSFSFVSVHPEFPEGKCTYYPGMALLEYRKFMKEQHFDIGLAPLNEDEFSKCKYFNKFIEYTTQGIVGVYSKTEPYTYVVKNEINGFLAENNPASWLDILRKAINDSLLRKKCLENAVSYLRDEHSEKAIIDRMIENIPEIIDEQKQYKKCGSFEQYKMIYYLSRPFDKLYLFVFFLKKVGIAAVIKKIQRHFVEVKAYSRRNSK